MTTAGWLIMLLSIGGVTALFLWTLIRVLGDRANPDERDAGN